jgi:hypothetical protein
MPNIGALALSQYNWFYTNTNATGSLKSVVTGLTASALLHTITVNTAGTGTTLTVYDSSYTISGSVVTMGNPTNVLAVINTAVVGSYHYDVLLTYGLVVVPSSGSVNANITIAYR